MKHELQNLGRQAILEEVVINQPGYRWPVLITTAAGTYPALLQRFSDGGYAFRCDDETVVAVVNKFEFAQ